MSPRFTTSEVRRYYDRQTSGFVTLGQGGSAIHRAVWGPGVADRHGAFHYVDERIVELILKLPHSDGARHIVDLGCGVGGTLEYLAGQLPIRGTGVTLSPVQAELAMRRIRAQGLSGRVSIVEGDYCRLPPSVAHAHLAYAIESFVHTPDPAAFFAESARLLEPDGLLVICDDFVSTDAGQDAERTIEEFRQGWRVNTLLDTDAVRALARTAGFDAVSTVDLSSWLEINRPRDRAIAAFLSLFGWLPLERTPLAHLSGGRALQRGLKRGWIRYELHCFRKQSARPPR